MSTQPVIAITMGDAAGIGPEVCLRALGDRRVLGACIPVIFGDRAVLARVASACGLPPPPEGMALDAWHALKTIARPLVVDCGPFDAQAVAPGRVSAACGLLAYRALTVAVDAVRNGRAAAVATAPLNKQSLHLANIPHPGHTEILAELTGAERVCMMLASDELAVSLATIHVGLAAVPEHLTRLAVQDAIELTYDAMRRIGKVSPRIAVCGLNPHGGEAGLFGNEEQAIIQPAMEAAALNGCPAIGPLVPDTAFLTEKRRKIDAYVAMYHDQGLIPFKMLAFESGVNITLGLPIVRTSVDHGTAFDMAWQGKASCESMVASILWARRLAL